MVTFGKYTRKSDPLQVGHKGNLYIQFPLTTNGLYKTEIFTNCHVFDSILDNDRVILKVEGYNTYNDKIEPIFIENADFVFEENDEGFIKN